MPIYTLAQLRATAPEQFRDLPDDELVTKYSQNTGMPFEQAANLFGVKPRGTLAEMGRQALGGAVVDLPKMIGQGLEYTGLAPEYGREMAQNAEARAADYNPDMRGRGLVGQALVSGARGVAPVAAIAPLAFIPGVGEVAAGVGAATLFGTSSAQETLDKLRAQGIPEEEALAAARRVGMIQGPLEGIATVAGGRALKGLSPVLGIGGRSAEEVARGMTNTAIAKPLLKSTAINMGVQTGTEVAQDLGTYAVEQAYGAKAEDPFAIAKQSALGGAGLSAILGPLSLGGHMSRSRNAAQLKEALYSENTPTEVRAQAIDAVMAEAKRQGVADQNIDEWFNSQLDFEDMRLAKQKELEDEATKKYGDLTKGIVTEADPIDLQDYIDRMLGIKTAEDKLQEVDLIGGAASKAEGYTSGQRGLLPAGDKLQQVETRAPAAPGIIQSAPGIFYTQPTAPVDLTTPALGREMPRQEQPPVRPSLSQIRTGMFQTPILNSQRALAEEEGGPLAAGPATAQPVLPPGATDAVQPAAPVVAGASLKAPKRGPKTPQAKQAKAQGQKPAAPAVTPAQVAEGEEADNVAAQSAIDELGLRPLAGNSGSHLQASVRGGKINVSGRASYDAPTLAKASGAFLSGKADTESKTPGGKLAQAARDFGGKYLEYLNAASAMVPTESASTTRFTLKRTKKFPQTGEAAQSQARADQYVGTVQAKWEEAQKALSALGEASGNNAKNVEVMIRLIKDKLAARKAAIDAKMAATEDGDQLSALTAEMKALEKLDLGLAQGWASAKRGIFRDTADILDVRGGDVRTMKEEQAQGFEQPLVRAAEYGAALGPNSPVETGFMGVMNYVRSKGTPFERMIAKGVSEVFKNTKNPPKIVFEEGKSQYDPKTNTVTMSPTASPEVALHEALHAALQWYVHSKPNDPVVRQLLNSVNQVVKFDTKKLSPKAAEVQAVLAKLVKGKRELDAMLELVSYGNTLVEFRKALEAMPSKGTPESFAKAAKDVWNMILATVRRMLGLKNNSAASDVIMGSFRLLEQASSTEYAKSSGKILEATVQSSKPLSNAKIAAALGKTETDYTQWESKNLINVLSTQRIFEAIGWSQENAEKLAGKLASWGRETAKKYPSAEIVAGLLNSRYNVNSDVSNIQDNYKFDKNVGYQIAERIANYITGKSAPEVIAVFDYLDGNKKALDNVDDGGKTKGLADNMKRWFDLYVSELSPIEQRFFTTRKFSENLLFPSRTEEVARNQFGLGAINKILGRKSEFEANIDPEWMVKDANGDPVASGDFYRVFKINGLKGIESAGFMAVDRFKQLNEQQPMGFKVDTSRKWILEAGDVDKGNFKFTTNTTAREKALDEKADDLANALRNTMAALANNYASKNFINAMAKMGSEGSPHAKVAFDSIAEINKEFGTTLDEEGDDRVLRVSEEMSRSEKTKDLYRMSGTWVQLPANENVYGALAGKLLPGPVWNSMVDMYSRQPVVDSRAFNNIMRWFKKSKTTLNPGTHVTNAASNITMAMMHDISFKTMRDATKLLYKYEVTPKALTTQERLMVESFINSGAMLGDFSSAEVKEALYKAHEKNLLNQGNDDSLLVRVTGWMGIEKSKAEYLQGKLSKADEVTSHVYAFEDNAFRMAAFMKAVAQEQIKAGVKTPTEEMFRTAGKFALGAFGDYDIDSKAVKALRQTVMPFVSWGYAMGPMIGRIALTQPWKIANVLMAYYLLEAGMSSAAGGDDEEVRKSGPESIRERMFFGAVGPYMHVRIPFMGDDENPVYYKLGDYFPVASMTKGLPNGFAGQSWIPSMVSPSGPLVSAVASLILGVDTYTGKSIHQPTDTEWQKLWNTTKAAYDIVSPPGISSKQIGRANDFFDGKTGITGVEPSPMVFARAFGLKLYDYNVAESEAIQDLAVKRIEHDFKTAMAKAQRDEFRKGYPDYEALDATLDDLLTRMEEEKAKKRGEE